MEAINNKTEISLLCPVENIALNVSLIDTDTFYMYDPPVSVLIRLDCINSQMITNLFQAETEYGV